MEPVSNVDRLVLLLRRRLQERERAKGPGRTARGKPPPAGGITAAKALAAIEEVDDRQLRRALVQGLLADQFGGGLINDARFQQVVDRVIGAIEGDEAGRALLDRITSELRLSAR